MRKARSELSQTGEKLIEAFGQAAMDHGWKSDQGSEEEADAAAVVYVRTKQHLERYITMLENQLADYKAIHNAIKGD
jgi:hypothetical protein